MKSWRSSVALAAFVLALFPFRVTAQQAAGPPIPFEDIGACPFRSAGTLDSFPARLG